MDMITVTAKTVDEAVTKALIELETTSDKLEYEVVEKGSAGFLGIGAKPAIIRAKKKETLEDRAIDFLSQVFDAMNLDVKIAAAFNEEECEMNIDLSGEDMGFLIGKRPDPGSLPVSGQPGCQQEERELRPREARYRELPRETERDA